MGKTHSEHASNVELKTDVTFNL